jgi:hypothetical protein
MPFLLILIGAVLIVSAYRNTYGDLATALETDVPGFATWALAIAAVAALGWVPGMQKISRWLLALVIVVLVLRNYQALFANAQTLAKLPAATPAQTTPTAAYLASPTAPNITTADISGGTSAGSSSTIAGSINAANQIATVTSPLGAYDPAAYLTQFEAGVGGFGGVA